MKEYNLNFLISSELEEKEINEIIEKIKTLIEQTGGIFVNIKESKKVSFGVPIKKKTEGFLISLDFSLSPEKIEDLSKKIKVEHQILRYLILTKKPKKEKIYFTKKRHSLIQPRKEKKVELKEIDKKIEEILTNNNTNL